MRLFRVILPVSGLDAAARFYELLLDTPGERVSPGRHYIVLGECVIALVDPLTDSQGRSARANQEHVYFATDDLDAARQRAIAAHPPDGPSEIAVQPWGERSFYLTDTSGNPLCVVEAGTEFTSGWVE